MADASKSRASQPRSTYGEIFEKHTSNRSRSRSRSRTQVIIAWLCAIVLGLVILGGIVVLLAWIVLQPHKPRYYIDYGSISQLNISHRVLNTRMTFNVTGHNPNDCIGIYYDKMEAYASYAYQRIAGAYIAPFYQGRKNTTIVRPILTGHYVVLKEDISRALAVEHFFGDVELRLKLYARIRFKVGRWKSGHYNMKVSCNVKVEMNRGSASGSFKPTRCAVYF